MCISKRFQLLIIEWNADDQRRAPWPRLGRYLKIRFWSSSIPSLLFWVYEKRWQMRSQDSACDQSKSFNFRQSKTWMHQRSLLIITAMLATNTNSHGLCSYSMLRYSKLNTWSKHSWRQIFQHAKRPRLPDIHTVGGRPSRCLYIANCLAERPRP